MKLEPDPRLSKKEHQDLKNKNRFNHSFYQLKTSTNAGGMISRGRFFSIIKKEKGNFPFPR